AEAKALGIHRGDSFFSLAEIVKHANVEVFSSNYALYQDLSDRVMETLLSSVGSCRPYSIDEAFFTVETTGQAFVDGLRKEMLVKTGIPVSISVARTRTLAKLANEVSKHNATGAYSLPVEDEERLLKASPAGEVWGIGWGSAAKLDRFKIKTAWDYANRDDLWIRKHFFVTGLRTALELRGCDAVSLEAENCQNLCSGISFGVPLQSEDEVSIALSCHCSSLSEKLHKRNLLATVMTVSLFTDRFKENFIHPAGSVRLWRPSSYTPDLIKAANRILSLIYHPAKYKGCRVWVSDLIPDDYRQFELADSPAMVQHVQKCDQVAQVVSSIQDTYGRTAIVCASSYMKNKADLMRQEHLSPHYTTRWGDLPSVT
ncbi:MAG: DUF4113 domain-containing protein, partial [Sphaerochaetaceae bacterium]